MNKRFFVFVFSLIAIGFISYSCEKDDICSEVTPDTPQLIIRFFDATDIETVKAVPSLRVVAVREDSNVFFETGDRTDRDSIAIPLRTQQLTTRYLLINNSASNDDGNETGQIDTLDITYTRSDEFISRACGFRAIFELTEVSSPDIDKWIAADPAIEIINTTVENENAAHVKIFH
ncbi:DUF6452 family protein [Spongiivirga citrea]|uniref:Uncharacterized protein n=1 Tax=Spongiivirga citrea TaxID=1481457 RepID=A0A6M0CER2_9FLAO|nr:DUF6452 family protein [Spongiivirga citrea]NER16318.1 hypothetical protein [Spongiivirga citrea]